MNDNPQIRNLGEIKLIKLIEDLVLEKTGKDITNEELIKKLKAENGISDEIFNFFLKGKDVSKKTEKKRSNIERIIVRDKDDIPEKYRDGFIEHIDQFSEKPFDFNQTDFPLDEFGDSIIKSLYVWDPISDPLMKTNYKHFFMKVDEEVMTKDLILLKDTKEEVKEENTDWDSIIDEM